MGAYSEENLPIHFCKRYEDLLGSVLEFSHTLDKCRLSLAKFISLKTRAKSILWPNLSQTKEKMFEKKLGKTPPVSYKWGS